MLNLSCVFYFSFDWVFIWRWYWKNKEHENLCDDEFLKEIFFGFYEDDEFFFMKMMKDECR